MFSKEEHWRRELVIVYIWRDTSSESVESSGCTGAEVNLHSFTQSFLPPTHNDVSLDSDAADGEPCIHARRNNVSGP